MSTTRPTSVQELSLDLSNFRTIPQADELHAIKTMIALRPEWFWALTESLIDDGYLPTENILVLRKEGAELVVKEGNRRIAALKLLHGYWPLDAIAIPNNIMRKIATLSPEWKAENEKISCTIYDSKDEAKVDRIVTLAHGKGEQAGRDKWNAVAHARHNRDYSKSSEPALDLLEKYLKVGKNVTSEEATLWAGDYPLTVLQEAIKRTATQFGADNAPDLAKKYPSIPHRDTIEKLLKDIGHKIIGFKGIRSTKEDFAISYGLPPEKSQMAENGKAGENPGTIQTGQSVDSAVSSVPQSTSTNSDTKASSQVNTKSQGSSGASEAVPDVAAVQKAAAVAINDPQAVKRALTAFTPRGDNRAKVVTLRDEALQLNLNKNPLAFCFLLRSMFEISAKAYCDDHKANGGPEYTKSDGKERPLVDIIRDVTEHMTSLLDKKDKLTLTKAFHGAMVELSNPESILSVVSMNQLIHNPKFSTTASDISTKFGNVYPLLEAMNR